MAGPQSTRAGTGDAYRVRSVTDVEVDGSRGDGGTVAQSLDHEVHFHDFGGEGTEQCAGMGRGGERDQEVTDSTGTQHADQAREGVQDLVTLEEEVEGLDRPKAGGVQPPRDTVIPKGQPRRPVPGVRRPASRVRTLRSRREQLLLEKDRHEVMGADRGHAEVQQVRILVQIEAYRFRRGDAVEAGQLEDQVVEAGPIFKTGRGT